jgi:hypothetical protein
MSSKYLTKEHFDSLLHLRRGDKVKVIFNVDDPKKDYLEMGNKVYKLNKRPRWAINYSTGVYDRLIVCLNKNTYVIMYLDLKRETEYIIKMVEDNNISYKPKNKPRQV